MVEVSPIENRYLGSMRELDTLVKGITKGMDFPMEIIDHDFAPSHAPMEPRPHSLRGFDTELQRLRDDIPEGQIDADVMRQNIDSTTTAIGALAGDLVIGENISYQDYVEMTLGARPEMTSETDLQEQRRGVVEAMRRLGYEYDESQREGFNEEHAIDEEDMEGTVEELIDVAYQDLSQAAGSTRLEGLERPGVKVVRSPDIWQGYFGTDDDGEFIIEANSNPDLKISPLEERIMLDHENGHWLSSATKKAMIATGEMSPIRGMLLGLSRAYPQEEIIARTVEEYILGNQPGDFADYLSRSIKYKIDVGVNMAIMANTGYSQDEVAQYGREYLPMDKPEKIIQEARTYGDSLLFKTVFSIDSIAIHGGRRIAALPDSQRQAVIGQLCAGGTLPDQLSPVAETAEISDPTRS